MTKIAGSGSASGSISQRHGSADPDPDPEPHQNVVYSQHCCILLVYKLSLTYFGYLRSTVLAGTPDRLYISVSVSWLACCPRSVPGHLYE
jgi:hypothetical protein